MRRLAGWRPQEIIDYNLRDGGTQFTNFADGQPARVDKAREIIANLVTRIEGPANIVELGCSSGDISGFFAEDHLVSGFDVVPAAVRATIERWPRMNVELTKVEDVLPFGCDILVLTEMLEHVHDPIKLVTDWMPKARYVVIGHPLVGDGPDQEAGHVWGYTDYDFQMWFAMTGHHVRQAWEFDMAGYRMILGWGENADMAMRS